MFLHLNKCRRSQVLVRGFTLMEILIALMIFAIVSILLASGLRSVIDLSQNIQTKAKALRDVSFALIVFSRDITQAVNRPIRNAANQEEAAFLGSSTQLTFTHQGYADPTGQAIQSSLQRVQYVFSKNQIERRTWMVLDQARDTQPTARILAKGVNKGHFEFLDKDGLWRDSWQNSPLTPMPRAIRLTAEVNLLGEVVHWYVVSPNSVS